jgi:hypothetical protein
VRFRYARRGGGALAMALGEQVAMRGDRGRFAEDIRESIVEVELAGQDVLVSGSVDGGV